MDKNKIQFGLRNVHYSVVTETTATDGTTTSSYGGVKAWPGAVNMTLDVEGDTSNFYADDSVYAVLATNAGYSGSLESALVPDDVYESVFGMTKDTNGLVLENKDDKIKYIALMFEINGDQAARKYVFYRTLLSRPGIEGSTVEDSKEAKTQTVDITVSPRPDDGIVKGHADAGTTIYDTFYSAVPVPTAKTVSEG